MGRSPPLTTFAPSCGTFAKGRDFAAWVGLTPRQHSSGGKERLGKISKMGSATINIRRLLIIGAVAVVKWAARKGSGGLWLARMMARKSRMLVAVALATRMAPIAWALMRKGEVYRDPAVVAA